MDPLAQILTNQYEAALAMLHQCIRLCPPQHWEGRIANDTFRQIAYHTLFFADYYLSPGDAAFTLRNLHDRGGDERGPALSPGLPQDETLAYAELCHNKAVETLAAETPATLAAPCGFPRKTFTRAELHIYNIRHIQHHAAQASAYLRRVDEALRNPKAMRWIGSGWPDA